MGGNILGGSFDIKLELGDDERTLNFNLKLEHSD